MPLDHYKTIGKSGLRVSPLALGGMTFGEDLGWGSTPEVSTQILDRYIDLGGNFIDTANGYTKGHSEKIIGDHIAHDREKRDRLVIATKFSTNLYFGDPNGGGSSRKAIIQQCEQTLRRLRTDYIDLYWLHNYDQHTPIEETMAALHALVEAGKVRYIGVSDTPAWKATQGQLIAEMRGWTPFIATQIEYSLSERTVEGEFMPMAEELGMGVIAWSPLGAGRLTGKYTRENPKGDGAGRSEVQAPRMNDKLFDIVDELKRIAQAKDVSAAQVALAWLLARPGVTAPIIGARSMDHLEDNLKALELQLTDEETAKLDDLSAPQLPWPLGFLAITPALHQGGTTINGIPSKPGPFAAQHKDDHY